MKKGRSIIVNILLVINLLAVICLFASYGAGYISPEEYWIFAFFGLAYPAFLLINVIFVVLWLFLWKRYLLLSLVAILIGWNSLLTIYPFPFLQKDLPVGHPIQIVSYNVHHFYGNQRASSIPETRSKITNFLTKQGSDIICIQEYFAIGEDFTKTLAQFAESIGMDYFTFRNYKTFYNKQKIVAIATFSRHPIVNSGFLQFPDHPLFACFSDMVIDGDTVRVYNLHLESIRFGNDDYSFYSQFTEPEKEVTPLKEGSKRMIWKIRKAFISRSKQVDMLARHIADCPYPVILAGDFNDTPSSHTYHQLTSGLNDSFVEAGNKFFDGTYAGQLPSFRIDYILHSREFQVLNYQKIDVDLSDHYPITSTLVLNP